MNSPVFLQQTSEGVVLNLKVQPRASRNEIGEVLGNELKLKVTAPPVESAANEAVLELLSGILDCGKNALRLLRGRTSRHKQILITGLTLEAIARKLQRQ